VKMVARRIKTIGKKRLTKFKLKKKVNVQRTEFSSQMKEEVYDLYDGMCAESIPGFECPNSGRVLGRCFDIDHIIPSSCNPKKCSQIFNAQLLCLDCHREKSIREKKYFPSSNMINIEKKDKKTIWKNWLKPMVAYSHRITDKEEYYLLKSLHYSF
jgi:5-methylcytosine-specific restriction endonuclease McrA